MKKRSRFCKELRYQGEQNGNAAVEISVDADGEWTDQECTRVLEDVEKTLREAKDRLGDMMLGSRL